MTLDLPRLASAVTDRRLQLNLSVKRAADAAGLSKDTWARVEAGEPVRHMTYDKIETSLGWTVGSCRKVLDGGEAVVLSEGSGAGIRFSVVPPEAIEGAFRDAVRDALVASTDDLTTAQIRQVNDRAIEILRTRGILPPEM